MYRSLRYKSRVRAEKIVLRMLSCKDRRRDSVGLLAKRTSGSALLYRREDSVFMILLAFARACPAPA
jgi:hypothetical protein